MTESGIEQRLAALAQEFEMPHAPDLAGRVRERIDADPERRPRVGLHGFGRRAAVAAIALLALGGAAYASPLRDDILDLVDIRGVEIEVVPELPATEDPVRLGLGAPADEAEAERRAGFALMTARTGLLSGPRRTFLGKVGGEPIVSFVYSASPALPEIDAAGTGLVLSQFQPGSEAIFVKKVLAGAEPERVSVGGTRGYWIGDDHAASLPIEPVDPRAMPRIAGHVLIWQRGATMLRLEADVTKAQGVAAARAVRRSPRSGARPRK